MNFIKGFQIQAESTFCVFCICISDTPNCFWVIQRFLYTFRKLQGFAVIVHIVYISEEFKTKKYCEKRHHNIISTGGYKKWSISI